MEPPAAVTARPAVVSVHDVTPPKLEAVGRVLDLLESGNIAPVTLLVVPGFRWEAPEISRLRELVRRGYLLAGHGWEHSAPPPANLFHRLHAALISRDQAEHLSRTRADVRDRVRRCHDWFERVGLPRPELYVPPAWALGALTRSDLVRLPFRWYEVLAGFLDARSSRLTAAPVVGFEADTLGRQVALGAVNRLNLCLGRCSRRPVRIAIHPGDLGLRLAPALRSVLEREWRYTSAESFLAARNGGPPSGSTTAPQV